MLVIINNVETKDKTEKIRTFTGHAWKEQDREKFYKTKKSVKVKCTQNAIQLNLNFKDKHKP